MRTASQLLADALAHVPEDSDLRVEIGGYLGEPVHMGDMLTIKILPARGGGDSEGLEVTEVPFTYTDPDGSTVDDTYKLYRMPEFGPASYIRSKEWSEMKGIFVVEIHGIRYAVDVVLESGEWGCEGGVVIFTRTDADLTTFIEWDAAAELAKARAREVQYLATARDNLTDPEDTEDTGYTGYLQSQVKSYEGRIQDIDAGEVIVRPGHYAKVFGQPIWRQGEIHPAYEGRCSSCLATFDTGHGDSGNVNILFACDEQGIPVRAWFESSSS